MVPESPHYRDYPERIAEILSVLELREDRSQLFIIKDLGVTPLRRRVALWLIWILPLLMLLFLLPRRENGHWWIYAEIY
jgi:hypothetical protein